MRPSAKFPYLEHDGVLAFAHRGGDRRAPENTIAAFADAAAQGYRYLETDVHVSRDGEVFAFHDDSLLRMTGEDIAISTLDAVDIETIKVVGDHAIPRMENLLEAFPECRFNIDAKAWPVVEPLADLIRGLGVDARVSIVAFSDARILKICQLVGRPICHSVGPREAARFRLAAWLGLNAYFSAGCVQLPVDVKGVGLITQASVAHAHKLGLQVHAWTINDESTMHNLIDMGVDGIMTDDCALLKSVLVERNMWA